MICRADTFSNTLKVLHEMTAIQKWKIADFELMNVKFFWVLIKGSWKESL